MQNDCCSHLEETTALLGWSLGGFFTCLHFHFSGVFKGFLDEVMKKYGSLVPLCEKDVMGRLKEVFNEDFSHRCVAVSNSRLCEGQIACIAPACSMSDT